MKHLTTLLFFIVLGLLALAQEPAQKPQSFTEQMPSFPGGEDALHNFLQKNINYPNEAFKGKIEGTVVLQFVVNMDGGITDIKVIRGVEGGCTEEAIRVVKMMPHWIPGNNNGSVVPVYFNLPIVFQLLDKSTSDTKPNDRITVFDRNDKSGLAAFAGYDTTRDHLPWTSIKLNPTLLVGGDLPIYIERQIGVKSSVEGAVGITFNDYSLAAFGSYFGMPDWNDNDVWKVGYSLKLGYRFYPGIRNIMDGFYLSPQLALRTNKVEYPDYSSGLNNVTNTYNTYYDGRYTTFDIRFLMGYQSDLFDSDYVIFDFYTGVGIRFINSKYFEDDNNGVAVNQVESVSEIRPDFYLGIKLGFKWR